MKPLLIISLTLLLTGCYKNLPVGPEMMPIAEKLCATANAKPSLVSTRSWFPTFNVDMYIICEKEDSKDKIGISVEVK